MIWAAKHDTHAKRPALPRHLAAKAMPKHDAGGCNPQRRCGDCRLCEAPSRGGEALQGLIHMLRSDAPQQPARAREAPVQMSAAVHQASPHGRRMKPDKTLVRASPARPSATVPSPGLVGAPHTHLRLRPEPRRSSAWPMKAGATWGLSMPYCCVQGARNAALSQRTLAANLVRPALSFIL